MTTHEKLLLGALGVGAVLLWKLKGAAEAAADEYIARPIAYVISKFVLPGEFHIAGGAVLPDGGYVSWDAIRDAGSKLGSDMTFLWRAKRYRVLRRRPDGNYDAALA